MEAAVVNLSMLWLTGNHVYTNSPPDSPKVFRNLSKVLLYLGRIFLTVLVASEMLDIISREKWSAKYRCSN